MEVTALTFSSTALYVAGTFTGYRGANQFLLAKLDPASGNLDPAFAPVTTFHIDIPYSCVTSSALAISANTLYVAGCPLHFAGGIDGSGLARVDATTGAPDATFTQAVGLGRNTALVIYVRDIVLSGPSIYAGGNFSRNLPGSNTKALNLIKVDAASGSPDEAFSASGVPNGWGVAAMSISSGVLHIGGSFDSYGTTPTPSMVGVDPATGAIRD